MSPKNKSSIISKTSFVFLLIFIGFLVIYPIILVFSIQSNMNDVNKSKDIISDIKIVIDNLEKEHDAIKRAVEDIELFTKRNNYNVNELNKIKNEVNNLPITHISNPDINRHQLTTNTNNIIAKDKDNSNQVIDNQIHTIEERNNEDGSTLIVGGTDGSGTRRVVQILVDLGVTMVSEDPQTYDIHADSIGGWPVLVKDVIKSMKRLNYDIKDLPSQHLDKSKLSIQKLLVLAEEDSHKPESFQLAKGGCLKKPLNKQASGVRYGFKAPVAMTLVPLWANSIDNFKFLHVLRDGRDIAFSANQGPVDKFYNEMYSPDNLRRELQAIRLWSDWNYDIYDWSMKRLDIKSNNKYGYFVLHSEDLVSDKIYIKFKAIYELAKWVKSNLNNDEICCLAVKGTEFLGSHDGTTAISVKSDKAITSRYGKWKNMVGSNKDLNDKIHFYGKKGLEIFGYEPLRPLPDQSFSTDDGYKCVLAVKDCNIKNPIDYSFEDRCNILVNTDYKGGNYLSTNHNQFIFLLSGDIELPDAIITVSDSSECCKSCLNMSECKHFTLDTNSNVCYLKSNHGNILTDSSKYSHLVSGDRL